jgi:hypothetical protein
VCTVSGTSLRTGATGSCGCLRKGSHGTHGGTGTPEYASWTAMMNRCYNPKRRDYARYGARGITVCARWHKFENFYADMSPRPKGFTLERENNNKGYSRVNCTWVSRYAQTQNRSNTVRVTHAGRTQSLSAWARELGVPQSTLNWRRQRGWDDAAIIGGKN